MQYIKRIRFSIVHKILLFYVYPPPRTFFRNSLGLNVRMIQIQNPGRAENFFNRGRISPKNLPVNFKIPPLQFPSNNGIISLTKAMTEQVCVRQTFQRAGEGVSPVSVASAENPSGAAG